MSNSGIKSKKFPLQRLFNHINQIFPFLLFQSIPVVMGINGGFFRTVFGYFLINFVPIILYFCDSEAVQKELCKFKFC